MKKKEVGAVWFTLGCQGGTLQPPYAVKWKGRWWRTLPIRDPNGVSMDDETRKLVESMPGIPFGLRKLLDYLERTGKRFNDLPLFTAEIWKRFEEEEGEEDLE